MSSKDTAEAALYLKQQRNSFVLCMSFPEIGKIRWEITEVQVTRLLKGFL